MGFTISVILITLIFAFLFDRVERKRLALEELKGFKESNKKEYANITLSEYSWERGSVFPITGIERNFHEDKGISSEDKDRKLLMEEFQEVIYPSKKVRIVEN